MKKVLVGLLLIISIFTFSSKVLVVGTTDKIRTLDPAKCYDYFSSNILQNVLTGLVDYEVNTSNLIPSLAESWDVSSDGLVYTFHLRKDAKFEDGTPIDASVMKYSIDRAMKLNGDPAFLLTDIVDSTNVVDEYTFQIKLKYPFSAFLSVLGYTVAWPVNPNLYPENAFYEGAPSSSGPYKITEWIRDVRIVLERNDKFFGPAPKVDKVVITFYESAATLRLALETGQIDIAFRHLDPRDISDLENNPGINVIKGSSPQIRYLVLNTKQAPFSDPLVRKAIMYAVDRQRIVDDVFVGLAQPLYSMVPMGMWSHKDIFPERNLSAAKRLLQQAGYWTDKPLTIDLWYSPTHYGTTEADVAQVLKESLEETGIIKINIKYAEWSTYVDYFLNGTMGLFLLGWYPDYIDPDDYLWPFLSINGAKSMGSFYENPTTEAIMKAARICVNQEARSELYAQTQNHLVVDVPNIPLWQGVAVVATQKNIKGVLLEPTQIFRYYLIEKK